MKLPLSLRQERCRTFGYLRTRGINTHTRLYNFALWKVRRCGLPGVRLEYNGVLYTVQNVVDKGATYNSAGPLLAHLGRHSNSPGRRHYREGKGADGEREHITLTSQSKVILKWYIKKQLGSEQLRHTPRHQTPHCQTL